MSKKKIYWVVGLILIVVGAIAIIYAQSEINSSFGYSWTEPYSAFESKIIAIKNIGIGSLVLGIVDVVVLAFANLFKGKDN